MPVSLHGNSGPYAVILPVCNEAEALPPVISELQAVTRGWPITVVAGLNGCTDTSAEVLKANKVPFGVATEAGYGHGCVAAIQHADGCTKAPSAYIFLAADGANDPQDLSRLIAAHQEGAQFVLGQRTRRLRNWPRLGPFQLVANTVLGLWASFLTGTAFGDIGPMRLIDAHLYRRLELVERHYGWTIEAQVMACRLGVPMTTIAVTERQRLAGMQKVSGVSLRHSLKVGWAIAIAGWRAARRPIEKHDCSTFRTPCVKVTNS